MGGIPRIYTRPIPDYPADKWRSTFTAHTRRNPPSKEPGVDYYCPIGTTLFSIGSGYVAEVGGNINAATGRYVKVNLDNGQSFRLLHLGPRHSLKRVGQHVGWGEPLAISGASGYGSEYFGASSPYDAQMILNTGGPHTHATLFPTHSYNNFRGLLDLEQWVMDTAPAGGGASPFEPPIEDGDDMSFAMKVAGDAGRGPVEITPGYQPNPLTEEEFDNFYGGKAIICNARQYDVNVARVSRLAPRDTAAFLGRGTSPDRPWTLFAPGYIFPYAGGIADELLGNQPFATRTLSGNDRQYDLWTVQALTGSLPASVDLDDDEVARLAKAARDAFRIDPLK